MKVIISGPPRSGKTTLAKELAESLGIPYISLSPSAVFSEETLERLKDEYSYNPNDHAFNLRLFSIDKEFSRDFQKSLLDARINAISLTSSFVTDRGLLDSWVYYTIEVAPQESLVQTKNFLVDCFRVLDSIDIYSITHPHGKPIQEEKPGSINNPFYAKSLDLLYSYYFQAYIKPRTSVTSVDLTSPEHSLRMEMLLMAYNSHIIRGGQEPPLPVISPDISNFARIRVNARNNGSLKAKCKQVGLEEIPTKCGCHFFSYLSLNEIRKQIPQVRLSIYKTQGQKTTAVRQYPFTCPKTGLQGQMDWAYTYQNYPDQTDKLFS